MAIYTRHYFVSEQDETVLVTLSLHVIPVDGNNSISEDTLPLSLNGCFLSLTKGKETPSNDYQTNYLRAISHPKSTSCLRCSIKHLTAKPSTTRVSFILKTTSSLLKSTSSGVNLSPEEHAQGKMGSFRAALVEVARLDPHVGSVQFDKLVGNGAGSDWAVDFSEKDFNISAQFDRQKGGQTVRTREIGYVLSVTLLQKNIPMTGSPEHPPRHFMVTLS